MTLSSSDTLWSGRGGGGNLHVARLFGRPITIPQAYQTANQVAMRNFVAWGDSQGIRGALLARLQS